MTRSSESKHVEFCVDSLFSLLGWRISKNKLLDFNTLCKVLGVQLDLRQSGDKLCFVTNTEKRVQELVSELDEAMRNNTLPIGVRVRSSEEGFSSPAHRFLEESAGGC